MIRTGHPTTVLAGGNLTRSLVSSTTVITDRIRQREATLSADGDSILGAGGYENIVVRKEAQESSAQTRISEKVARGDLHTGERNVCSALSDQNQQFQAAVREHQRRARVAVNHAVRECSEQK